MSLDHMRLFYESLHDMTFKIYHTNLHIQMLSDRKSGPMFKSTDKKLKYKMTEDQPY